MRNLIKINTIDSTNHWLKAQSVQQTFSEGTVVMAEFQTAGKGQQGNLWESEAGRNITCSIILYPEFLPVKQYFLLSEAVALGLKDAIEHYLRPVEIKWPNDIYYQNKKLAGILMENQWYGQMIGQSVIGIGLNVNQEQFSDIAPNAVSMKQILGEETNINLLMEKMIDAILFRYNELKVGNIRSIVSAYHDALYRKSGFHLFADKNGRFIARTERVADDGLIHLITDTEEKRSYTFKEVSYG
jgi:BirA family biotin operon repressor/biotin-[acetyl-CoA-carboxylase] ligase